MAFFSINKNFRLSLIVTSLGLVNSAVTAQPVRSTPVIQIQEERFVTLGGIEQWITIRGSNRANPVLLIVHGGPGDAQSSLRSVYAIYERDFTVVQWDQRGAGKTYARNRNSPPEPERVELDGIELAQYLCNYLGKKNIIVLGHSWGSHLAVEMVQKRPDLFAAYVGTGQVGSWRDNVQTQFNFLLAKARAANDRKRVEQLEAIGTPNPNDANQYFSWWSMRNPYMPADDANWFRELREIAKSDPQFTDEFMQTFGEGMQYSGRTTVRAMLATELPTTANAIGVPFFVIQGKEDMVTPTSVAMGYFKVVRAPKKRLILIDHAGHFALVTHREEFLAALNKYVRPLAIKSERH
jgi:pimeloyl-ACP methyl ester carboxylesterase